MAVHFGKEILVMPDVESPTVEPTHPRVITIPVADWAKFEAWANAPAKLVPALVKLAATKAVWDDDATARS